MRTIGGHGTRTRYIHHGCRCDLCRHANKKYNVEYRRLRPHPNGLVPAKRARMHLRKLLRRGVGIRSVSAVIETPYQHLGCIRRGVTLRIKRNTEQRILSVSADACADSAIIPIGNTAYLIKRLTKEGFTYKRLAVQLKLWPETLRRLPTRKRVYASTKMKVEKFYNRIMAEAA